jgi:hypothetical protein
MTWQTIGAAGPVRLSILLLFGSMQAVHRSGLL